MMNSDPIADMLTRIRNANTAKHDTVDVPASKMKVSIANILLSEGYIKSFELVDAGTFKNIHITLKYGKDKNDKVLTGLKRISKPGLRVYANVEDLPKVLGGLGTAIISTNKGVITDKEARKENVGGEVLCFADTTYGKVGVKVWIYHGEVLPSRKNSDKKQKENKEGKEGSVK